MQAVPHAHENPEQICQNLSISKSEEFWEL